MQRSLNGELSPLQHATYRQAQEDIAARILAAPTEALLDSAAIGDLPRAVRLMGGPESRAEATAFLRVQDRDEVIEIGFDDMLLLHGRENIGGVALAFKALEYAFARLAPDGPIERDTVEIFSAFAGSGTLDGFEAALRVATNNRLFVDTGFEDPRATPAASGHFCFRVSTPRNSVAFTVKSGAVPKRFMDLALKNRDGRLTPIERTVFQAVKEDLAMTLLAHDAEVLFEEMP